MPKSPHPHLPSPSALDDDLAALDARIRHKLDMRIPLTHEERAYFTRLPGEREWTAEALQRAYAQIARAQDDADATKPSRTTPMPPRADPKRAVELT